LVKASALLVSGDQGWQIDLMLQAAARFARNGLKVIYVSGEESNAQVQMRARRLSPENPVMLASDAICATSSPHRGGKAI
jgi:DNA repair protein RadA/Sms